MFEVAPYVPRCSVVQKVHQKPYRMMMMMLTFETCIHIVYAIHYSYTQWSSTSKQRKSSLLYFGRIQYSFGSAVKADVQHQTR